MSYRGASIVQVITSTNLDLLHRTTLNLQTIFSLWP